LLGLFAASSHLHDALHHEAGQTGHTCAITLFSESLEDSIGSARVVITPAFFPVGVSFVDRTAPRPDAHDRLPPACGPPLC